jgi:hypothetical protein
MRIMIALRARKEKEREQGILGRGSTQGVYLLGSYAGSSMGFEV